jgi:GTP-binding protein
VPNLGVITFEDQESLTIADIPGLIKGAGEGKGLGHRFLKHIERTGFLLYILDVTRTQDKDILEDYDTLNHELKTYNPALARKKKFVLLNKMDIYTDTDGLVEKIQNRLQKEGVSSLPISAKTGAGLDTLRSILKGFVFNE